VAQLEIAGLACISSYINDNGVSVLCHGLMCTSMHIWCKLLPYRQFSVTLGGPDAGRCTPLNDSNYAWASGTSMAVPHVAGAAAIFLAQNPNATPAQVSQAITAASTPGLLDTDGMLPGTPNRLLYVGPNVI